MNHLGEIIVICAVRHLNKLVFTHHYTCIQYILWSGDVVAQSPGQSDDYFIPPWKIYYPTIIYSFNYPCRAAAVPGRRCRLQSGTDISQPRLNSSLGTIHPPKYHKRLRNFKHNTTTGHMPSKTIWKNLTWSERPAAF